VLSSEMLGHSPQARVLIINADDFGMYPSVNNAVPQSIENGIASSCSLMPPCPGARQALELLHEILRASTSSAHMVPSECALSLSKGADPAASRTERMARLGRSTTVGEFVTPILSS
jgi:YdjC-like protein